MDKQSISLLGLSVTHKADGCWLRFVASNGVVGRSIIQTAAGPMCSVCGRGVNCWLSHDQSPCRCSDDTLRGDVRP